MTLSSKNVAEVLREACSINRELLHIKLCRETIEEIVRILEGKAKKLSLDDVRDWCMIRSTEKDPIFIVPDQGPGFWIRGMGDVGDFHKRVMLGQYVCWTGRPTEEQLKEAKKVG